MMMMMMMDPFTMDMPVERVVDSTGALIYRPGAKKFGVYNTPPPWSGGALPPKHAQHGAPTQQTLEAHDRACQDDDSTDDGCGGGGSHVGSHGGTSEASQEYCIPPCEEGDSFLTDSSSSRSRTASSARTRSCSSSECVSSRAGSEFGHGDDNNGDGDDDLRGGCKTQLKGETLYGTTYRFSKPIHLIQQVRELHDAIVREVCEVEHTVGESYTEIVCRNNNEVAGLHEQIGRLNEKIEAGYKDYINGKTTTNQSSIVEAVDESFINGNPYLPWYVTTVWVFGAQLPSQDTMASLYYVKHGCYLD